MRRITGIAVGTEDTLHVAHDDRISVFGLGLNYVRTVVPARAWYVPGLVCLHGRDYLALRRASVGGADFPLRRFQPNGAATAAFGESTPFGDGRVYADLAVARGHDVRNTTVSSHMSALVFTNTESATA